MSMSMESMEWGRELEGGAVGVVVDVGVGDLTEVVPVTRAGLLAPAARSVPRTQPLRGRRRRRSRRRRRQLHPLIITRAPWSSSSCTRSLRCSSHSFSFSRCTPTWAMRGGSGCAASA